MWATYGTQCFMQYFLSVNIRLNILISYSLYEISMETSVQWNTRRGQVHGVELCACPREFAGPSCEVRIVLAKLPGQLLKSSNFAL